VGFSREVNMDRRQVKEKDMGKAILFFILGHAEVG
jgi:hypothetical protein